MKRVLLVALLSINSFFSIAQADKVDECTNGYYCSAILACYGNDQYGKYEIHAGWKNSRELYHPMVVSRMKYDNPRWKSGDWGSARVSYGDPFNIADISQPGLYGFMVSGSQGATSRQELWISANVNTSRFKARSLEYGGPANNHVLLRDISVDCELRPPR